MGRCKVPVEALTEYLKNRILAGTMPAGGLLPSVRKLAAQFHLSYSTAYRALVELSKDQWIERRAGSGFYANPPPSVDQYGIRVAVIMEVDAEHLNPGFLAYHILTGLRKVAAQNKAVLKIHSVHARNLTQDILNELTRGVAGVIMIGTYDTELNFLNLPCPGVGALMLKSYGGQISTVNLDLFDAILQAKTYFGRFVVKKTVIYSSSNYFYATMAHVYAMLQKNIGGKADVVFGIPENPAIFQPNVGYLFTSDQVLQQASELYFQKYGVPLAARHIVLGVDGKRLINPGYHSFATLAVDWSEMGRIAMQEMLRRIEDPDSVGRSQSVACRLVEPAPAVRRR